MELPTRTSADDRLISFPNIGGLSMLRIRYGSVLNTIGKEAFYHFLSQRSAADSDAILKAALQILFAQTKLVSARGASLWHSQVLKVQIPQDNTIYCYA